MTDLRLASVDGEQTIPISTGGLAEAARQFADLVDNGEFRASSAIVIAEVEGYVKLVCLGDSPTIIEAVGLLELTKARVIGGAFR